MHSSRVVAVLALVAALALAPGPAGGQSSDDGSAPLPTARQPHGLLPLEGTPWRLIGYRWRGRRHMPGPEVAASMVLVAGSLTASGGCTTFKGAYGGAGRAISFSLGALKANACAEQTKMVQQALVEGLRKARRYDIEAHAPGAELAVFDARGTELLRFTLDDLRRSLAGDWALEAYVVEGTREAAAGGQLRFSPQRPAGAKRRERGEVVGTTGCNGFTGNFTRRANVLAVGSLETTDAPCPRSLQRQEDALLAMMDETAVDIQLSGDRLVLTAPSSGDALQLRATVALEGTTWVLRGAADERDPAAIVTLRLEDGIATGQGPCGPYQAGYTSDGRFITFSDVRGEVDIDCEAAAQARSLLAALRAAVWVDRETAALSSEPGITLRDARGRALGRFEAPYASGP